MSFSVRTPRASFWSLLIAAPTKSYLAKRKRFDCMFEENPSQCQPTVETAYIFNVADFTHNTFNPTVKTTPTIAPPTTSPAT
jgi:hypothetical protein